ncbi:hypothetical protein E8E13_001721 [Curvularia kusanoi]|uniref:Protein kinase domain-containing protein n=1 Tax=Curvularia kusanoi TaxID=90978 RepID=A0A9P4T5V4_CURKU|nr:hypothetical protein E8E13_001721 [Curvularia kusanoi]
MSERDLPEYPAPELLSGEELASPSANWWTLGVLLYEMLTGMPPFYDDNNEQRRRNILDQPVNFPDSVDPIAIDLLSKLLDRTPESRLGTGGTLSIQAHPFFHTVDWQRLLFRKYEVPFMPGYVADTLEHNGLGPAPEPERPLDQYRYLIKKDPASTEPEAKGRTQKQEALGSNASIAKHGDSYELEWHIETRTLYFRNPNTNMREHILAPATEGARCEAQDSHSASAIINSPDSAQKQAALEIALDIGDRRIISQLLDYGIDLNNQIVVNGGKITPLECAVRQGAVDLVTWFLKKSTPIINRVAGTRALGLAVDLRNIAVVEALLINGIRCDFEESDRPAPRDPSSGGCEFYDLSDPEGFLPPLVRAVRHGADVDIGPPVWN